MVWNSDLPTRPASHKVSPCHVYPTLTSCLLFLVISIEFDTWGGRRFCIDLWGLNVKSVPISFWRPSLKLFQVFSAKVPPDIVWKPLSYAEKNILKAPSSACRSFKIFVLKGFSSLCVGKGAKEDSRSGKDWGQDFDTFRSRCRRDGGARNLETHSLQEAYAVKGKLEPGQLAKVQRKPELEQAQRHIKTQGKKRTCKP